MAEKITPTLTPAVVAPAVTPAPTPAPAAPSTYKVQDGDTWASLGKKFGKGYATAVALMELNGGKALVAGEEIKVK